MSKHEKLIAKIRGRQQVSYKEAKALLIRLGYEVKETGSSHHTFRKVGKKAVTLKDRPQLLPYQLADLEEAINENR